jgi:hypothetical protein
MLIKILNAASNDGAVICTLDAVTTPLSLKLQLGRAPQLNDRDHHATQAVASIKCAPALAGGDWPYVASRPFLSSIASVARLNYAEVNGPACLCRYAGMRADPAPVSGTAMYPWGIVYDTLDGLGRTW